MSRPYKSAINEYLPGVDIVFDRFHIMQLATKMLDKVRKKQIAALNGMGYETIKGGKFLLLHNYENLGVDEKSRLNNLLAANHPLQVAYVMKEQLRLLWEKRTVESARKFLVDWCLDVIVTVDDYCTQTYSNVLNPLVSLAETLIRNMTGVLSYFKHWITNGKAEGINNKIKTLKRQAYGYRDNEYFKLRLYHIHKQKHCLTG